MAAVAAPALLRAWLALPMPEPARRKGPDGEARVDGVGEAVDGAMSPTNTPTRSVMSRWPPPGRNCVVS